MTRAELLSIGAELLLGETVDTNAAFLGAEMAALGMPLEAVSALPDDRGALATAFADARARSGIVLATGGLGPTHDDLSREGLADALGEELVEDPALVAALEERFKAFGRMPQVNRRQALRIASAEAIPNPIGSAPGWWVDRGDVVVVLMPGVPSEMRRMWADEVRPRLAARFPTAPLSIRTVKAFGVGESALAERLGSLLTDPPAGVQAGIYARDDGVHVRFSSATNAAGVDGCVAAAREALGEDVYGLDDGTLPAAALARLGSLGIETLSTWESGTNGALLAILAESSESAELSGSAGAQGVARYVGGVLDMGTESGPPLAQGCLQVSLLRPDAGGRSRVRVSLSGACPMPVTELRLHGSGPQRLRRAAFAALDAVRRLSSNDR